MSRSRRMTPIFGYTTATTEKQDKRLANRAFRKAAKHCIKIEKEILPVFREVSNVWSFNKDGKHYVMPEHWEKEFLKKAMRK